MAKIVELFETRRRRKDVVSEVRCGYEAVHMDGEKFLILESYGSLDREKPDKISQSLHINREHAVELKKILETKFKGI